MKYKYGIVLMTNDPKVIDGVEDGIYVAMEFPEKPNDTIGNRNVMDVWLDEAKSALKRKLRGQTSSHPTQ